MAVWHARTEEEYWNDWVETKRVWDQRMDRADSVSERKENG